MTIDRFLEDETVRERFREDALGVIETLGLDLNERSVERISKGLGLSAGAGVAVPTAPLVIEGVMVASQIKDTPDDGDTDTDGTTGGTGGD